MEDEKITLCNSKNCRIKNYCARNIRNNVWMKNGPDKDKVENYFKKSGVCGFYITAINN